MFGIDSNKSTSKGHYDVLKCFHSVLDDDKDLYERDYDIETWNEITLTLLKNKGMRKRRLKFTNKEIENSLEGFQYINKDYKDTVFRGTVCEVTFDIFYSQATYQLIDNLQFNYRHYPEVWKSVYETYTLTGPTEDMSSELKRWLNWSFGAVNNSKTEIHCDVNYQNAVKEKANGILELIKTAYSQNIPLIDTDRMYVIGWDEVSGKNIKVFVDQFDYEYSVTDTETFIPIEKRKYVGIKNGNFFSHGFKNMDETELHRLQGKDVVDQILN